MNPKAKGEKGERIAIGELAKWDIDVAVPLTDNLRWDFIIIHNNKLFRAQVKSSTQVTKGCKGSVEFDLSSSNWYRGTISKYTDADCDVMVLCDYENIYLLKPEEFSNRKGFSIRREPGRNGQTKGMNFHDDFVLSKKRIKEVLR